MKPEPSATPATTGTTVEYTVRFATAPKGRKRVRAAASVVKAVPTPPVSPPPRLTQPVTPPPRAVPTPQDQSPALTRRISKIALLLVLGHHFERLVRDGVVKDYAEIARRTGLTRARVTQITALLQLAPDIQEAILQMQVTGGTDPLHERSLRAAVGEPDWRRQRLVAPIKR